MRLKTGFIRKMVFFYGSLLMLGTALAQVRLEGSLVVREFIATANQVEYRTLPLFMSVFGAEKADFEYLGMSTLDLGPNFTVVSPSKGVAPTTVSVGLNPNVVPYLRPGTYRGGPLFGIPGQPCPGACVGGAASAPAAASATASHGHRKRGDPPTRNRAGDAGFDSRD